VGRETVRVCVWRDEMERETVRVHKRERVEERKCENVCVCVCVCERERREMKCGIKNENMMRKKHVAE
jgi:hypothetical protein